MKAEIGDLVKVHYTGRLDDGSVFDSSVGNAPLLFELGGHNVIAGFENAVVGMEKGGKKMVKIPASEAYGQRKEHLSAEIPFSQLGDLPKKVALKKGLSFQMKDQLGNVVIANVVDVKSSSIILDLNHPLAGKDLTFDIEVVEVMKK
jgi:peptidylprolyl isomerase